MDEREIKQKFQKYLEINENGNTAYKNLWDAEKAILTLKFITRNIYINTKKDLKQPNIKPQGSGKRANYAQSWENKGDNKDQGDQENNRKDEQN